MGLHGVSKFSIQPQNCTSHLSQMSQVHFRTILLPPHHVHLRSKFSEPSQVPLHLCSPWNAPKTRRRKRLNKAHAWASLLVQIPLYGAIIEEYVSSARRGPPTRQQWITTLSSPSHMVPRFYFFSGYFCLAKPVGWHWMKPFWRPEARASTTSGSLLHRAL